MNIEYVTKEQLIENNGDKDKKFWILIGNKVYDVTTFKHPGGKIIFKEPGPCADLEEEFTDAGHSNSAIEKMSNLYVGIYKQD